MNPFEMVVVIVFLAFASSMFSSWIKHRGNKGSPADDRRLADLEERIRVLERIVTDPSYDVRRQFRDLERDA